MPRKIDLTGQRFERLTVIEEYGRDKWGKVLWKCLCDCQKNVPEEERKYVITTSYHLKNGDVKSCGCLSRENVIKRNKRLKKYNEYKIFNNIVFVKYSNKNEYFICDLDDWEKLKEYTWYKSTGGYACSKGFNGKTILFHRIIMNCPDGLVPDHIYPVSGGVCDNRKSNLEICTTSENCMKSIRKSSHGIIGIRLIKKTGRWNARIKVNQKTINLGNFLNFNDAVIARLKAEKKYFGKFAPQKHLFEQYGI